MNRCEGVGRSLSAPGGFFGQNPSKELQVLCSNYRTLNRTEQLIHMAEGNHGSPEMTVRTGRGCPKGTEGLSRRDANNCIRSSPRVLKQFTRKVTHSGGLEAKLTLASPL